MYWVCQAPAVSRNSSTEFINRSTNKQVKMMQTVVLVLLAVATLASGVYQTSRFTPNSADKFVFIDETVPDINEYVFNAPATYRLVDGCESDSYTLPISIKTELRSTELLITSVLLKYEDVPMEVKASDPLFIFVNNVKLPLPYTVSGLTVFKDGTNVVMWLDDDIKIDYDANENIEISMKTADFGTAVCGLLGKINGNSMDDRNCAVNFNQVISGGPGSSVCSIQEFINMWIE